MPASGSEPISVVMPPPEELLAVAVPPSVERSLVPAPVSVPPVPVPLAPSSLDFLKRLSSPPLPGRSGGRYVSPAAVRRLARNIR